MFNIIKKEIDWGGKKLILETGRIARQADGAVLASLGDTSVLCTVTYSKKPKQDLDFLALTVSYIEKAFAKGLIPGGFHKREGKPSNHEILVSRLIDRAIRPLFPDNYYNEIQVTCTVLSFDQINDPQIVSLIGASAALYISGAPFLEPVAAAKIGYINNEIILNPDLISVNNGLLDLVIAGTEDFIMMVEAKSNELSEELILECLEKGSIHFSPVIKLIKDFASETTKVSINCPEVITLTSEHKEKVNKLVLNDLKKAFLIISKQDRRTEINRLKDLLITEFHQEISSNILDVKLLIRYFEELEKNIVRNKLITTGSRIDGRTKEEIRSIDCQVSVFPRTHGSALFTRGETQALVIATLGGVQDEQIVDNLVTGEVRENFYLHYNFPSFSVGEVAPIKAPGRREIGHGNLAYRALSAVIPDKTQFPYTVRIVSEITESNGSSSMATVCGGSLALMDAGIPIRKPVAGIAMGLILDNDEYVILSDIMGDEDHLGDMDFKVAGTDSGITALQMDIKVKGITLAIMKDALAQAKKGRHYILSKMNEVLSTARSQISSYAPQISTMKVHKDQIREIIGQGGKTIRDICETTNAKIDIAEDGTVTIFAAGLENIEKVKNMIKIILKQPDIGEIYSGKVIKILEFGAFIALGGGMEGLIRTSDIPKKADGNINLENGQEISVKIAEIDKKGRIRLEPNIA